MTRKVVALCLLLTPAAALADFDASAYPAYETCALCHGLEGISRTAKFPHLAGQKPGYIRAQIEAFLSGERTNDGGQMASIVTELKPGDIDVVAEWFSGKAPPPPGAPPPDDTGAKLFADNGCAACHSVDETAPYLTSQHARYLEKQMLDFAEGRRTHSPVAEMHRVTLTDIGSGIADIAAWLASTERPE